jgi:hypothetical protein
MRATVHAGRHGSQQKAADLLFASGRVRNRDEMQAQRIRDDAAAFYDAHYVGYAKTFAFMNGQKMTEARQRGGALGEVLVQMYGNPELAQPYVARVVTFGLWVTSKHRVCPVRAARAEQAKDASEDIAHTELLLDPNNIQKIDRCIEESEGAIAAMQMHIVALRQRKAALQRGDA